MAIFQALMAALSRSAGKLMNTAFSWATVLLFGKVPEDRQIYLSVMAFGSVAWLVALLGIAFPSVGTFLLAFVPLPEWVDHNWVRLAMLAAAVLLPLVVGFVATKMPNPQDQPKGAGATVKAMLRGYPSTLGLALTLLMLIIFAPVMKIQTIIRRWTSQHVPVLVEPEDYLGIVGEMQEALKTAGWQTQRRPASWMLRWPTKIVTMLAGGAVKNLIADRLTTLASDKLEVTLYPADLIVKGKEHDVVHARATIAEQLAFSKAYATWTKEGNELEDSIEGVWRELEKGGDRNRLRGQTAKLREISDTLKRAKLPYEEWEVLFREKLLVERGLLEVVAGLTDRPSDLTREKSEESGAGKVRAMGAPGVSLPAVSALAGAVALGAIAWRALGARR